jgi:hypothetical protein
MIPLKKFLNNKDIQTFETGKCLKRVGVNVYKISCIPFRKLMLDMQHLREEVHGMFQQLSQQIQTLLPSASHTPRHSSTRDPEEQQQPDDYHWEPLADDLPAAPAFREESLGKIAWQLELKQRAGLMTAGRDLHDIHTMLHVVAHWDHLSVPSRNYTAPCMRLLYLAITKGWPLALQYDQLGFEEFLDVQPELWTTLIQPVQRPQTAQRRPPGSHGRSATR